MSRLALAIEQIIFARNYTLRFLDTIDEADWFRMPSDGVTHIAWQVGHLAMAEYRMALQRIRGAQPEDANLTPCQDDLQEGAPRSSWKVPFVVGDLGAADEAKRMAGARGPKGHPCRLREPRNNRGPGSLL